MSDGRPLRWYRGEALGTRLHVAARWATAPIGPLEALLPSEGPILDWGCGHGVLATWAAARAAGRTVHGTDIDAAKLAVARRAAARAGLGDRASFETVSAEAQPTGTWAGIVICDVLYLLPAAQQRELVLAAAAALRPGGVLVVKEVGDDPRWKVRLSAAQEQVAVRAARITASAHGVQRAARPPELVRWLAEAGLAAEELRLDRGYHVAHRGVIARVGSAAGGPDGRLPS